MQILPSFVYSGKLPVHAEWPQECFPKWQGIVTQHRYRPWANWFSCLLKSRDRERERGMQARNAGAQHAHLHNFRAGVSCQSLLRGVDYRDLHQGIQLPITDRSHQILASWQRQGKEKEKKLTPCLREKLLSQVGSKNLAAALNEISGDSGWFYRGSPLEVPYRNRKSRAAELNWEFISTDHMCSFCKSLLCDCTRSSGTWVPVVINTRALIHTLRLSKQSQALSRKLAVWYWRWLFKVGRHTCSLPSYCLELASLLEDLESCTRTETGQRG